MNDASSSDSFPSDVPEELTGHLLVAHPGIADPHFFRSVVLISAHNREIGAVGVVINRPLDALLGHNDPEFAFGPLAQVPLFEGGPVHEEQLLLTAWNWAAAERAFELYFGISEEKAASLQAENPALVLRGFLGYAGWSPGQLEEELEKGGWAILPVGETRLCDTDAQNLWRWCVTQTVPEWLLLADCPEDTSAN